ncbi:hypothetical protein QYE76_049171 [Lolium multiflorum]|uniref:Jacalin-type lectin domain-containing protein n=1 Tax=Lolium multiflorum TaxID=4521 RepID=A0AAD8WFT0_LOLMU|nr:hypothetical protein QYE76_049171 [Lolium multiflorum]
MEKNTTGTSVMVLADSAAADAVITVDVDPEALSCPRCIRPLKRPVFQCAAGHLVCSSCHDNLPDKKACASCFVKTGYTRCFIPTDYSRCHGVERILRSLSVACPNAIYGCTAGKMLYHEKTEHEKTCTSTAGSGGITGRVVKMGPCGGGGGNASEMDVNGLSRIVKVVIWHDMMVDGMLVFYELDGAEVRIKQWGLSSIAKCSEICLEQDEYLIDMKGKLGDCKGSYRLRSLTLVSNRRTFGPYGTEEGAPFELPAAGGRIVGFHGRSGTFLDALGTYVKMDA